MLTLRLCCAALIAVAAAAAHAQVQEGILDCTDPNVADALCEETVQNEVEGWLERHPLGEPVTPEVVEDMEGQDQLGLPTPSDGVRYAVIDGMVVALDPTSYELLQVLRRSAAVEVVPEDGDRPHGGADVRVPPGHLPPAGSCRVWFPGRPPGHQPAPTSCDVEVPPGAVLVRG